MSETRLDPDSGSTLVPVDHDPYSEPEPPGYFDKIGQDLADFWQQPVAHVKQRLADIGGSFADVARGGLQQQHELLNTDYSNQPLIGVDPQSWALTGRIPALAETVRSGMAGPVPGGGAGGVVLGAGPRIGRGAGEIPAALETPLADTLKASQFAQDLRAAHLARGEGALPLSGAAQNVSPPPHIQTPEDMDALVNRYADLAQGGAVARDWYKNSGQSILAHTGSPEAADRFAAALAGTSPQTDVAGNAAQAVRAWNQAMAGDPALKAGRYPNVMGARVARYLYEGEPVTGEKIGPFNSALGAEWNPDFAHAFVNDIWNMRALGYPPELGKLKDAPYYTGTPTLGQHNFARIVADRAADVLSERTGETWAPQQVQAAAWAGIKSETEGTPAGDAAFNFADALKSRYAQQSWESAPGETTNHMPEFHSADPIDQQAYHDAIRGVLEDPQGRDVISQHFGLLTGPSFQGPGVFQGTVRPGSQAQTVTGMAPGSFLRGVDPATKDLLDAAEATRGLLLRQDASAWHQPVFRSTLKPGQSNLADIDIGRPLTTSEAQAAVEAMHGASGSDFFSPIATQNGFRFLNVPEVSGVSNVDFQKAVAKALGDDRLPDATIRPAFADSGYIANDWKEDPGGQGYLRAITGTGRPDLERRAAQLLATLGPRVSEVEDHFANTLGWTPDRASRVWETSPQIQRHGPQNRLTPPEPWEQRPAAPNSRPPFLIPVDHDPFAEAPAGQAPPPAPITAWHGSPYTFEQFDPSKMGSGEGATAYGRGLYFAEARPTAEYYRDTTSGGAPSVFGRAGRVQDVLKQAGHDLDLDSANAVGIGAWDTSMNPAQAATRLYTQFPSLRRLDPGAGVMDPKPNLEAAIAAERQNVPTPRLYQVGIRLDPETMLDWDKPLSQQPQAVQRLVQDEGVPVKPTDPGSEIHRQLTNQQFLEPLDQHPNDVGSLQARAAEKLHAAGVPGVRYLDEFSRGDFQVDRARTHNYVVFDPRTVDILKRYGLAGLMAGAGGAALLGAGQARAAAQ